MNEGIYLLNDICVARVQETASLACRKFAGRKKTEFPGRRKLSGNIRPGFYGCRKFAGSIRPGFLRVASLREGKN